MAVALLRLSNAAMASAVGSVVRIGLIARTLDVTENLVFDAFRHIAPVRIFQYIASGLTGMSASMAGWSQWRST